MRKALIKFRGDRTQLEMAQTYGVTQQVWSLWESGKSTPKIPMMLILARDSKKPIDVLFYDVFNKENLLKT